MSKVVERLVCMQMTAFLDSHKLLPDSQSAYRNHHSTETTVLKIVSDILQAAYSGKVTLLGLLSRRQTIDEVVQFLGRGLVSKDNRPMKCTTSKLLTCRVTNGGPIWSAFYVVLESKKTKQHKSVGVLIVCHFLTSQSWRDKWHDNDFISRSSLETKPRPKSWPTLSIVWCRL